MVTSLSKEEPIIYMCVCVCECVTACLWTLIPGFETKIFIGIILDLTLLTN